MSKERESIKQNIDTKLIIALGDLHELAYGALDYGDKQRYHDEASMLLNNVRKLIGEL